MKTSSRGAQLPMCNPQHQFKPGIVRDVMVFIVGQMLDPRTLWRDEFRLETWSRSPRSIATAFGLLQRIGLVKRMKQRRRSQIGRWRGRMVWKYQLTSVSPAFCLTTANARVLFEYTDSHHAADEPEARTMTSALHAEATAHSRAAECAAYIFDTHSGALSLIPAIGPEASAAGDAGRPTPPPRTRTRTRVSATHAAWNPACSSCCWT